VKTLRTLCTSKRNCLVKGSRRRADKGQKKKRKEKKRKKVAQTVVLVALHQTISQKMLCFGTRTAYFSALLAASTVYY
jgi:hypothetical protein